MDYAGMDYRNIRFPVDRPLTAGEKEHQFKKKVASDAEAKDFLSVIKLNSNYIELVDNWYPVKGFSTWFGIFLLLLGGGVIFVFLWFFLLSDHARSLETVD